MISGAKNGTFEEAYNKTDVSPIGARYMQLQLWVGSNPEESSSYLIDNIIIKDISNYGQPKNNLKEFENVNPVDQKLILSSNEGFLRVEVKKGNSTNYKGGDSYCKNVGNRRWIHVKRTQEIRK